ncbi:MAG TPA: response regulator transcription factor [Candidatus Acidoferrales bacterium]|nr:response regulator transcription factor [Candidatus Acidoferrales bacterium]
MMKSLRILLADDHDLMRRGLKAMIETHPGWEVCGEAHTGKEAVAKAEQLKPHVAVLDISMPEMDGLEAARQIRKNFPETEVLVLSMHYSDQIIREVVEAGILGYVTKSESDRDLVLAVEALANHKPFFTSHATELMLTNLSAAGGSFRRGSSDVKERLTPREREIIRLISEGNSSKQVASALGISVKTADTHRANIMRKVQVHTVSDLVRYALRNKIIEA